MRRWFGRRPVRVVLVVAAALIVGVAAWQLALAWLGDPWLRVYSHDGRPVMRPSFRILSSPGKPALFASDGWALIEIPADLDAEGREIVVAGPGCGLLRAKFGGEHRLVLPPPIRATIRVPGEFELPSGDHGISLRFHALGVSPDAASALLCAPAPATYWDGPPPLLGSSNHVWLDPATRSVSVLLPCTGAWRVVWTHEERPEPGEFRSLSIVFGMGESVLTIGSDGEEHALGIDPEEMYNGGLGDD